MSDVTSAGATADDLPAPAEGLLLTHFLTVSDVPRSRAFYADVLGGTVVLDENPCIVKVANSWIIMNPGGGPTDDKPNVILRTPEDPNTVSSFLNPDPPADRRHGGARNEEMPCDLR
jgi:catechol 2,3-dioxygenase-like lactoylglutathione lyase family enzyme